MTLQHTCAHHPVRGGVYKETQYTPRGSCGFEHTAMHMTTIQRMCLDACPYRIAPRVSQRLLGF